MKETKENSEDLWDGRVISLWSSKEHKKYYVMAFLLAIFISECLSYLVWLEIVEPFRVATYKNPTPFMSHISYNPFLAFSIYIVLNYLLSKKIFLKLFLLFYRTRD